MLVISIVFAELLHAVNALLDLFVNALWALADIASRGAVTLPSLTTSVAAAALTPLSPMRRSAIFLLRAVVSILSYLLLRRRVRVVIPGQGTAVGVEEPEFATIVRPSSKVVCFRGVPYAKLAGRFEAPVPMRSSVSAALDAATVVANPVSWSLTHVLGTPATACPQAPRFAFDSPIFFTFFKSLYLKVLGPGVFGSESDCLQLNIWMPLSRVPQAQSLPRGTHFSHTHVEDGGSATTVPPSLSSQPLLPVFVFIHGGAFFFGSPHQHLTAGTNFARADIIVVSITYRLGILGWVSLPGRATNCGLRDQLEALRWVKHNILHFGGDPDNITVAGESAGSMAVGTLLAVDAVYSERLFHKAVMMSGSATFTHSAKQHFETLSQIALEANVPIDRIASYLATCPLRELVRLQDKTVAAFVAAQRQNKYIDRILPFHPHFAAGDDLLPVHPEIAILLRKAAGLPLMPLLIGYTNAEFALFAAVNRRHAPKMELLKPRLEGLLTSLGGHVTLQQQQQQQLQLGLGADNADNDSGGDDGDDGDEATALLQFGVSNEIGGDAERRSLILGEIDAAAASVAIGNVATTASRDNFFVVGQPAHVGVAGSSGTVSSPCATTAADAILSAYQEGNYVKRRLRTRNALWIAIHTDWGFRFPCERLATVIASPDIGPVLTAPQPLLQQFYKRYPAVLDAIVAVPPATGGAALPAAAPSRSTVFFYRFQHRCAIKSLDSLHILDLHYLFGTWDSPPYFTLGYSRTTSENSREVRAEFQAFVRQSPTNLDALERTASATWRAWDGETRPTKVFAEDESAGALMHSIKCAKGSIFVEENVDRREAEAWGATMASIPLSLMLHDPPPSSAFC